MMQIRSLYLTSILLVFVIAAQAQNTREELARKMEPLYQANLKTTQEYTCNMAVINLDRQNALDMMNGKKPPVSRYDSIIAKTTECIGVIGPRSVLYDYRAKAFAEKGDTKNALADYEKAISTYKTETSPIARLDEIYEGRADLYMSLGERSKAEADLREATRLNPNGYSAKNKLDNLDRKMEEARKKAAIANPKTAEDYAIVGDDQERIGKYDAALTAYNKSISLKPTAAAYVGRARVYRMTKKEEAAITDLNTAIGMSPKDLSAVVLRGYIYRDLKRWNDAIADFNKAMAMDTKPAPDMLIGRAHAYTGKGMYDVAIKDFDAALALANSDVYIYSKINALNGKGDALRMMGKITEALTAYNASITAAGNDYFAKLNLYDTYLGRGKLYASQGKTALAKDDFNAALKMVPDSKEAKEELAKLSGNNNNISTGTKSALEWAADGRYAANAKKWDEAITAFTECIKLAPDSAGCYAFRGAVFGMKGDISASRTDFDKALKLSKNNPAIYFMRGQMYMQTGKKQEAVADFREVLRMAPGNPQAIKALEMLGEKP